MEAAALVVVLTVVVAVVAARVALDVAPWLGTWHYELTATEIVVRTVLPPSLPLPARRILFETIERVERTAGPPVGGRTRPWRLGYKRLLGSNRTADTVDLIRRGPWRPMVVLTPSEPDDFARELRVALAAWRAEGGTVPRPWYTRQS